MGVDGTPGAALPRVVSLVPSATETLVALGGHVVACTRFCHQPGIPTVGGTKTPDVPAIEALRPDRVVVDTEENRREDAEALRSAGLDVVVTSVRSLSDACAAVRLLADVAGVAAPDAEAASYDDDGPGRTAFVPIWRRPWMTINAATYGASLLHSLGVSLVTAGMATEYPTVELRAVAPLAPELVLVPSEPYAFTDAHVGELANALPDSRLIRIDGEDLFWWGIRTDAARQRLRNALR